MKLTRILLSLTATAFLLCLFLLPPVANNVSAASFDKNQTAQAAQTVALRGTLTVTVRDYLADYLADYFGTSPTATLSAEIVVTQRNSEFSLLTTTTNELPGSSYKIFARTYAAMPETRPDDYFTNAKNSEDWRKLRFRLFTEQRTKNQMDAPIRSTISETPNCFATSRRTNLRLGS